MLSVNEVVHGDNFTIYHGDCVEVASALPDESIDYSIYSPPFASLFTYSDSERDMGNVESDAEFFEQYRFLVEQQFRLCKPGRLVSVHCMNLPSTITNDGYIGIRDFRGDIIRTFTGEGFIYHSEVCIWKNPVVAMQRTKALGLLHKQIKKDSAMSRQGIPDYICTFRKPGKNADPITGEFEKFIGDQQTFENTGNLSIDVWQRYASPVWMDIDQSRTLNGRLGRDESDTRHICPLQLDVIERCLELWSKPGDVVMSPFLGVGSEGVVSVDAGRKFIGVELKDTYFREAVRFLKQSENEMRESRLF
jgi:DNA modification methylase